MGSGAGFGGMMGGGGGGMTNGFEGVGKLKGHESKLFRYQLVVFRTEYMEEGFQPCEEYDGKYVEGELINMLTPHHKLQLAADLAKRVVNKVYAITTGNDTPSCFILRLDVSKISNWD